MILGDGVRWNVYQLQSLYMGLIPQVLLEIEAVHVLVDETEGVRLSRVRPHEYYHAHASVVKEATHANLIVIPLQDGKSMPLSLG